MGVNVNLITVPAMFPKKIQSKSLETCKAYAIAPPILPEYLLDFYSLFQITARKVYVKRQKSPKP